MRGCVGQANKIDRIDLIQFVLLVLSECTEDSSSSFISRKFSIVLILQSQASQDPIFFSLDST